MTTNGFNRGLAAMPGQERSYRIDAQNPDGDLFDQQRQHAEAMARNKPPEALNSRTEDQPSQWDDADWDQDHDEAAGHRARRLLSSSNSGLHRLGDGIGRLRRWLAPERWVKRLAIVLAVLAVIFAGCFGGLWRRLGAAPVSLERGAAGRGGGRVAGGGERGKYPPRQHRRGDRQPDRARRQNSYRRPHSRHRRS